MPKKQPKTVSRTIVRENKEDKLIGPKGDKDLNLTLKRELFCKLFASDKEFFGNGVESYAESYGFNLSDPQQYRAAHAGASRLLQNAKCLERINGYLNDGPLNDQFMDKQLAFVATQNADFGAKMSAIREYNKLKGRIMQKTLNLHAKVPEPLLGGDSRKVVKADQQDSTKVVENATVVSETVTVVKKRDKDGPIHPDDRN